MSKEEKQEYQEVVEVEEEHKWTLQNYFRGIGKFKWWVIGATVLGAVAGYLGFRLVLNPLRKSLNIEYTLKLAGKEDESGTIRFIDGSQFNTYDLTSRENLETVVSSNEKAYSKINIDRIIEKQGITISKNATYYNENDPNSLQVTYSMKATASLFPSDKIGKQFIYDLVNLPKTISTKAIKNYNAEIVITKDFDELTFGNQIDVLEKQYTSILNVYTNLSENTDSFGPSTIVNGDGKQLREVQSEYEETYKRLAGGAQSFAQELRGTLDSKFYINFNEEEVEETIATIKALCESEIKTLKSNTEQLSILEEHLADLQSGQLVNMTDSELIKEVMELSQKIDDLKTSNRNIKAELKRYGYVDDGMGNFTRDPAETESGLGKLEHIADNAAWVNGCKAFKQRIDQYKEQLITDRGTATDVYRYCYTTYQNKINILNGGGVSLNGNISNLLGGVIGLFGGFIIASFVTACVYIYRREDEKK